MSNEQNNRAAKCPTCGHAGKVNSLSGMCYAPKSEREKYKPCGHKCPVPASDAPAWCVKHCEHDPKWMKGDPSQVSERKPWCMHEDYDGFCGHVCEFAPAEPSERHEFLKYPRGKFPRPEDSINKCWEVVGMLYCGQPREAPIHQDGAFGCALTCARWVPYDENHKAYNDEIDCTCGGGTIPALASPRQVEPSPQIDEITGDRVRDLQPSSLSSKEIDLSHFLIIEPHANGSVYIINPDPLDPVNGMEAVVAKCESLEEARREARRLTAIAAARAGQSPSPPPQTDAPERIYLPADTDASAWRVLAKNPSRNWRTGEPANNIEYVRFDLAGDAGRVATLEDGLRHLLAHYCTVLRMLHRTAGHRRPFEDCIIVACSEGQSNVSRARELLEKKL